MNPLYQQALDGTLKSVYKQDIGTRKFHNKFPFPINLSYIQTDGQHHRLYSGIAPDVAVDVLHVYIGYYFLFSHYYSGSFIGLTTFDETKPQEQIEVGPDYMVLPNDIGDIPEPAEDYRIPTDSPRVLVGYGTLPHGRYLVREQYWDRQSDSYSLANNEKQIASFTVTSGRESTSSTEESVAISLGTSVGGGWGGLSANVSASLSASGTYFQQFTVTEQSTSFHSKELTNKTGGPVTYLLWMMKDVVTVYDLATGKVHSSVVQAQLPVIVKGPYPPYHSAVQEQYLRARAAASMLGPADLPRPA